ncbi:hypothetical protein H5410_015052 [Solanum commersonii]|uniref:Uncharacterized protein n=1 Tax=Solanum commersonii TaxID=4109 RepID=A0A9J5ZT90_SOLCO|nr:hypothetical protein H5410_015052 [Solanum commersonii]
MIKVGDFEPNDNLVTRRKCRKASLHKDSTKQHIREKMAEINVYYYQELRRPITLGVYFPSWFYTNFTCDGTKELCCNFDDKEVKDAPSS